MSVFADRIAPASGLVSHLARAARRIGTDALIGRARSLPRSAADLDAAALSALTGRAVSSVSVLDADAGTSSRARLELTGHGVPPTVFVKTAAATMPIRLMGELGNLADTETRFYQQLAPALTDVPRAYGAGFDSWTGRFVIVLEDLAATQCEFPDTLHPITVDQAAQVVEVLAAVHATFWNRLPARRGNGPLGWLYSASEDDVSLLTAPLLRSSTRRLAERTDLPLDRGRFINDHYRAVAALIDAPPHTVMHGDAHPGNLYFRDGRAGLLDWQAVRRGHPSRELAYTLVTSMTTQDRIAVQRDLLDVYRQALAAGGGPEIARDELWDRYRKGALYPYVAALITAGMGGMQEETIALKGLDRALEALADLETVALLEKAL
ncbi:phosphotransferase [Mycolicibacterium duvalii]|uniref:Phosphotransferase n=1 Tax=Mycolicibacterium duvalii TaxID=39688 RepID=A0A7I7K1Q1_9MYCO|nr:phosphotransferase [Mycolicibacterium duvalii]MCV7370213.1 phosphotransferase [Mycolicibacterium duvalii]PEG43621.1 phosphotransferase [Mycolicibacterium duvalii]BBX17421.1 phosphotransferase [Mycolicibacterium duvalii]